MNDIAEKQGAAEQIEFIERMIRQSQQSFGHWGWAFVMWGVLHIAAYIWNQQAPDNEGLPWAILMPAGGLVMMVAGIRAGMKSGKATAIDRALGGIWWAFGITMPILWGVGTATKTFAEPQVLFVMFYIAYAVANFASGIVLRQKVQIIVSILWWAAAVVVMLAPQYVEETFLAMVVIGELLFGVYLMWFDRREAQRASRA